MSRKSGAFHEGIKVRSTKRRSQLYEIWIRLKKNKAAVIGLIILCILILVSIFPFAIADYQKDAIKQNISMRLQGPSWQHLFGTDAYGRDIFARIIYGTRISLSFAVVSTVAGLIVGGLIGCISGYYGGKLDNIIMRIMDVFMAFPALLLAIALVAALGKGLGNLLIAITIPGIPSTARLFRALVISIRGQEFIESARAIGSKNNRIILRHVIPNIMGPILVQATLGISSLIVAVAALSFLGLGVEAPMPEWGGMLSEAKDYIRTLPYMIIFPGLAILSTVLSLNLLGDGLNDALDPKYRNR